MRRRPIGCYRRECLPIQEDEQKDRLRIAVNDLFRDDSRRVYATLVRLLGDFDLAEEVMQEAFAAAVTQWQRDGIPANPRADLNRWLGRKSDASAADQLALSLTKQEPERAFLKKRLLELSE